MIFDPASVQSERITENAQYEGIRIRFLGSLEKARINMQIDIGFGDSIYPGPEKFQLKPILEFPGPELICYSRESSIAEKFETMVKLGVLNSRVKDFYDVWLLSSQFDFEARDLSEAIRLTFEKRRTELIIDIDAFTERFAASRQEHWSAFRKRLQQDHLPVSFESVVLEVKSFLFPIVLYLLGKTQEPKKWIAPGPWK